MEKTKKNKEISEKNELVLRLFFGGTLGVWLAWVGFEIGLDNRTELLPVVFGFIFFKTANIIFQCCLGSGDTRFRVNVNTAVSLVHSFVTSCFVVCIFNNQWNRSANLGMLFRHHELVHITWPYAYSALAFSCGYFGYDQFDMLMYRLYDAGSFPSVLVHHIVLLVCFSLALHRNVTINYLILTLFCELHSVFLHVRKLRRMAGIRSAGNAFVKLEWMLNWVTFIFARVIPHALILIKLVRDAPKFDRGIELPLACFGMIGMNALNVGLGIDLFGAYKRESGLTNSNHRD